MSLVRLRADVGRGCSHPKACPGLEDLPPQDASRGCRASSQAAPASARAEQVILPWTSRPFPSLVSRRPPGSALSEVEGHAQREARTTGVWRQVLEAACQMPPLVCCLICGPGPPPNPWEPSGAAGQSCRPGASHTLSAHRGQPLSGYHHHRLPQTLEGPRLAEGPANQRVPLSMSGNKKQALPFLFFFSVSSFFLRF